MINNTPYSIARAKIAGGGTGYGSYAAVSAKLEANEAKRQEDT